MKKCCSCKELKDISEFGNRKDTKDGRQYKCNTCFAIAVKQSYYKNPLIKKEQNKIIWERISSELNCIKKNLGCIFCKEAEPVCLDFHHIDPATKNKEVSHWVHVRSRLKALKEAKKCIVICANCHRKLHAKILSLNVNVTEKPMELAS